MSQLYLLILGKPLNNRQNVKRLSDLPIISSCAGATDFRTPGNARSPNLSNIAAPAVQFLSAHFQAARHQARWLTRTQSLHRIQTPPYKWWNWQPVRGILSTIPCVGCYIGL